MGTPLGLSVCVKVGDEVVGVGVGRDVVGTMVGAVGEMLGA